MEYRHVIRLSNRLGYSRDNRKSDLYTNFIFKEKEMNKVAFCELNGSQKGSSSKPSKSTCTYSYTHIGRHYMIVRLEGKEGYPLALIPEVWEGAETRARELVACLMEKRND